MGPDGIRGGPKAPSNITRREWLLLGCLLGGPLGCLLGRPLGGLLRRSLLGRGAFFFAAGRFAAFFAGALRATFLAGAFLAGAFFFAAFFAGAFLAAAFFFAAGATFPPWDSSLNQSGTSRHHRGDPTSGTVLTHRVLARTRPTSQLCATDRSARSKREGASRTGAEWRRRETLTSSAEGHLKVHSLRKHQCQAFRSFFTTDCLTMTTRRGIYLGRDELGDITSGAERSTLVLGPTRSGKTSSFIMPNLLMTTAPCVMTSTKNDVVDADGARRDAMRATLLFDPSGTVRTPRGVLAWATRRCAQSLTWDGAVLATRTLVDVARRGRGDRADDHWTERAGALVAPLLHACALRGESLVAPRVSRRRATLPTTRWPS